MTNGPARLGGQAWLGLSESQRSEKLGRAQRCYSSWNRGPFFFPLFFFPGLEIIGLQSEIRRKGNNQKRNQFEQRQVTGRENSPHLPLPCCDATLLPRCGSACWGGGRAGHNRGHPSSPSPPGLGGGRTANEV